MSNLIGRGLALAVLTLGPALAHADTYQVQMISTVAETAPLSGISAIMPVGSNVVMSFTVDSTNFLNSVSYPTRGYVIDPSSFSLTANGVNIATALTTPTYFVLRNNDPKVDGFYLGSTPDSDTAFTATVPGLSQTFAFDYEETWSGGNQLSSLNIADAVGTFTLQDLEVYQMDLELGDGYVATTFNPPTVIISAVPEPASFGMMGVGLLALAGVARRRHRVRDVHAARA